MSGQIPDPDPNPAIITWVRKEGVLEKHTTHATPKMKTEMFRIQHAEQQIERIDGAIAKWQAKRKVHQDIIDRYIELEK